MATTTTEAAVEIPPRTVCASSPWPFRARFRTCHAAYHIWAHATPGRTRGGVRSRKLLGMLLTWTALLRNDVECRAGPSSCRAIQHGLDCAHRHQQFSQPHVPVDRFFIGKECARCLR